MSEIEAALKTAVIVEDDPEVRHLLAEVFDAAGFSTISVGNGIDGVRAVLQYQPLITTLDVNMPGLDGFEAARRIRAQSDTYIVMLTALDDEADVVLGLAAGADEYLNKPFRPRELRARINAILRRHQSRNATPPVRRQEQAGPSFPGARPATSSIPVMAPAPDYAYANPNGFEDRFAPSATAPSPTPRRDDDQPTIVVPEAGNERSASTALAPNDDGANWMRHRDLRLDPETHIVRIQDRELDLTRTEFDLLATLLASKRRVRSKADLTLVLRGESYVTKYLVGDADKRAIEAHMTNLRRKLGDSPTQPRYIETVRGVGYRLTSDTDDVDQ